jgi:hypothetical protein
MLTILRPGPAAFFVAVVSGIFPLGPTTGDCLLLTDSNCFCVLNLLLRVRNSIVAFSSFQLTGFSE